MGAGYGGEIQVLPAVESREPGMDKAPDRKKEHTSTGLSAATMRALSAQMFAFYFRAPVRAFFRARVDYMGYARAIHPRVQAGESWSWRLSSPVLLAHAIRKYGWFFIPNQVLPPLIANTTVGAILYTTYLTTLARLHSPSAQGSKRAYPPPSTGITFAAGFVAGGAQSVVAAPLDALQIRFRAAEMMQGKYTSMWHYAYRKTRDIGPRGVFAGWTLSFLRDSVGFGVFFATFEFIKAQAFYSFVSQFYGFYDRLSLLKRRDVDVQVLGDNQTPEIKPHYLLEPTFILCAGAAASVAQSTIQHPISRIQELHYQRLEWVDSRLRAPPAARDNSFHVYASAYRKTLKQCFALARRSGGMRRWLYADFLMGTLRQIPSTSAGLIVFEILRRKYSLDDEVKIHKDGYDILLV